jgi:hypothetical protein
VGTTPTHLIQHPCLIGTRPASICYRCDVGIWMKRSFPLYLVAAWCGFGLLMILGSVSRMVREYWTASYQTQPYWALAMVCWALVVLCGFVFIIWQTVGLVRMRTFNRWFAVVFFSWWSLQIFRNEVVFLRRPEVFFVRVVVLLSLLLCMNLFCACYLARRSFRQFAVEYVKERRSQMQQSAAQKRMRRDLRKSRS